MDETYEYLVERLRRKGRTTDYQAGERKAQYVWRRRLFGLGALSIALAWLILIGLTRSWILNVLETIVLGILFLYVMRQTTLLGYAISRVSEKSSEQMDAVLNEMLSPFPELHRIFQTWRAEGPIWREDESRLLEIARYALMKE